ncbi:hypothetical protein FOPE_01775 [Fonsecaea pedrosoi]|nr:hypothetical protein FOPE_01775 [Fonsecaea pedrosoi]
MSTWRAVRTKTGCVTCRKRHKKCDEQRPFCNNCSRAALICGGYHQISVWQPGYLRSHKKQRPVATLPVTAEPQTTHHVDLASRSPSSYSLSDDESHARTLEWCASQSSGPSDSANRPTPPGRRRRGTVSGEKSLDDQAHRVESTDLQFPQPRAASALYKAIPCLADGVKDELEQALLLHYLRSVPESFSSALSAVPFRSLLAPFALRDRGLLCTLLSISAQHLLKLHTISSQAPAVAVESKYWALKGESLQCHSERVKNVCADISAASPSASTLLPTFVSTLLLVQLDSLGQGKRQHWRLHLLAAAEIGRRLCQCEDEPAQRQDAALADLEMHRFALELYRYYDVLASITLNENVCPLTSDTFSPSRQNLRQGLLSQANADLIVLLSRIIALHQRTKHLFVTNGNEESLACLSPIDFAESLELSGIIQSWEACNPSRVERLLVDAYRQACFICLYLTVDPSKGEDVKVQKTRDYGLECLEAILRHNEDLECSLFAPFMLGIVSPLPSQQEFVRRFLQSKLFHGADNAQETLRFLQTWWREEMYRKQNFMWTWEAKLNSEQWCLVLF